MKQALCPTCGSTIEFDDFVVDLNTNVVSYHGLQRQAALQVVELIAVLFRKYPAVVRIDELANDMWGVRQFETLKDPANNLRQLVMKARKIGAALDFDIVSVPSVGYRLYLPPPLMLAPAGRGTSRKKTRPLLDNICQASLVRLSPGVSHSGGKKPKQEKSA
jgi:DNA-binding winged helix-turn-helix (wHTH) protein